MTDERLIIAIGRLERALSRVESATAAKAGGDPALAARHARLRTKTQAAIDALDRLVDKL